jgi:hypothetical protein
VSGALAPELATVLWRQARLGVCPACEAEAQEFPHLWRRNRAFRLIDRELEVLGQEQLDARWSAVNSSEVRSISSSVLMPPNSPADRDRKSSSIALSFSFSKSVHPSIY